MFKKSIDQLLDRYVRPQPGTTLANLAGKGAIAVPRKPPTRDRVALLRTHITRQSKILEFGPLTKPTVAFRDGWRVYTVDNADRAALVKRYEMHSFMKVDQIEEVDFIWTGGSILDVIPPEHLGTFDVVLMSHVLEHLPDPLRFLGDVARLLTPGGRISIAFPDKRHCFDALRPVTIASGWLEAQARGDIVHTRQSLYDHHASALGYKGMISWFDTRMRAEDTSYMGLMWGFHDTYYRQKPADGYVDCHAWVCTPASFALLIHECHALGVLSLALEGVTDSNGGEFFAHLIAAARPTFDHHQRLQLSMLSAQEQAEGYARLLPAKADPVRAFVQRFVRR
jgi:SAM-dependent methyltransferase